MSKVLQKLVFFKRFNNDEKDKCFHDAGGKNHRKYPLFLKKAFVGRIKNTVSWCRLKTSMNGSLFARKKAHNSVYDDVFGFFRHRWPVAEMLELPAS